MRLSPGILTWMSNTRRASFEYLVFPVLRSRIWDRIFAAVPLVPLLSTQLEPSRATERPGSTTLQQPVWISTQGASARTDGGTLINLVDVTKIYEIPGASPVVALEDVTLSVPKGAIHGIVGGSGAGKSTLIRCLTALERPTSGKIIVNDIDMTVLSGNALRAARRNIGMVFQAPNLLDSRTAAGNVAFPLKLAGESKDKTEKRVHDLLTMVGLGDRGVSYPAQLSGGQQQRVGIARGMATNPAVLLCDEPTSALDASSTKQVMSLLTELRDKAGVTVVIITHEMDVVRDYCDSVTLLQHGRVVQSGPIEVVLEKPDSALAEDLVPRPNLDGFEPEPGRTLLDIAFTSHPGIPTGATVLNLVASLGADVAAGRFESIGQLQVGRLAVTVPDYHARAIRGQLERNGIMVREWA